MSSRVIVCSVEIYGHFLDPNWELVADRFERDYNSLILGSLVLPETETCYILLVTPISLYGSAQAFSLQ